MQTLEVNQTIDIRRTRSRSALPTLDFDVIAEIFTENAADGISKKGLPEPQESSRCMFYSADIGPLWREDIASFRLQYYGSSVKSVLQKSIFWLNIVNPTASELALLQKAFQIHPLSIEDMLEHHGTRQKCDIFPTYSFILVKSVNDDWFSNNVHSCPISILIFKDCIITIQFNQNRHTEQVLDRMNSTGTPLSCEYVCYALLDFITDKFLNVSRRIQKEIDAIDDLVTILKANDQSDMLKRISICRRKVLRFSRLVNTKPELIRSVLTRIMSMSDMCLYMEDLFDQSLTLKRDFEQFESMLSQSHSHYLAGVNIEITQSSLRGSALANRITMLGSILVPLNIVTGLFGMNVMVPGQNERDLKWFFGIIAFMLLMTLVLVKFLRIP